MGPSIIWLPILLMMLQVLTAGGQDSRLRHFCSGTKFGRSFSNPLFRYQDLQLGFQNCTRIYGNVEISMWTTEALGNLTLDFFDDIIEIKGYLHIFGVDLERLSFKKLRIIHGDILIEGSALMIESSNLTTLSMPSLRSIGKGSFTLVNSPKLCHLRGTVSHSEFLDGDLTRYNDRIIGKGRRSAKTHCETELMKFPCHASCHRSGSDAFCYGPEPEDCQDIYRMTCPDSCESRQCYKNEKNVISCCHSQCAAGCTGPTNRDCTACANFQQCDIMDNLDEKCRCVEQCTSLKKYNIKTGRVEKNPLGFYAMDNRYCLPECPESRLVQDDVCVEHCGIGMRYDPTLNDRVCRKCDGACPKSCEVNAPITSRNIDQFKGCTEIEGFLQIDPDTLRSRILHVDESGGEINVTQPALKLHQLEVLKSIRFVSEYVAVAVGDIEDLKSLSFLENLEVIQGRSLFDNRHALVVSSNDYLESLGLRRLKRIVKGDVVISKNGQLCHTESVKWEKIVTGPNSTVFIKGNRMLEQCQKEGYVCHAMCDATLGCMGPTSSDCVACKHWREEGRCVEKCISRGFFENRANRTCERCYIECDTCRGPAATDCLSCRSYKIFALPGGQLPSSPDFDAEMDAIEAREDASTDGPSPDKSALALLPADVRLANLTQLMCVPECDAKRYYARDGECKRCHRSCYDFGCNGPSNELGRDGCLMCKMAQVAKPVGNETVGAVSRCLYNKRGENHRACENNDLLDHYPSPPHTKLVSEIECAPCDDECSTCHSKGTTRVVDQCVCENFMAYWPVYRNGTVVDHEERCVHQCPKGFYHDNSTLVPEVTGVCRTCSPMCDRYGDGPTCHGPTEHDCLKCAFYTHSNHTHKTCLKNCTDYPHATLYQYSKDRTCNLIDYEKKERTRNTLLYASIALFLVIVIIIGYILWKRQRRLSKELAQEKVANAPEMPELIPMDLSNAKPNKERLLLIPKQALSRSAKQLGSGAFGVVYAGCWMPKTGKIGKVPVAIKVVRDPSGRAQAEMLDEASKMTMLRHEHLLRIVGVCLSDEDLQLVTLLRPLGNLREFLQKHKGKLSGKELLQYSFQISSGMKYLADQRVVHRDLAARNVLVKNINHVEITDFGLAKLIDIGADSVQVGEGKVAIKWLAIEALEKQVYNTATDVWAFGVTVWEILTYGESPYANMTPQRIKDSLVCGERLAQPNNCSIELYKLLIDCWLPNPDSRPTFAVIKEILWRYCRAPYVFVFDAESRFASTELDEVSQRGLIEEMLDETDFEDPQSYFESEPSTPTCANNASDVFHPAGMRRMDSLGSQRYAQDPTTGHRKELGIMAEDNYLVPNSHAAEMGATMYTPVVVDEQGNSSLVESLGYYNEVKPGAEYVNDTQALDKGQGHTSKGERLSMIEEDDINLEKESCL